MKIKQKIVFLGISLFAVAALFAPIDASAADASSYTRENACQRAGYVWDAGTCREAADQGCSVDTAIIEVSCSNKDGVEGTAIWAVLNWVLGIMTALVAVAALGGVVYGAVLYTSAGGNAEQLKKARGIFTNVVIGVVAYGLMYVGLNFLIPGGVFN